MHWALWVVIGIAGLMYVVMPLIILLSQQMKRNPLLVEIDVRTLPPKAWDYLYKNVNAVIEVGFKPIAYLAIPSAVPNVKTYLALLVNTDTQDMAMVTTMFADEGNSTLYVEYSTKYSSGAMVDTMNSQVLQSFPAGPQTTRVQTPSVQDPGELYRLHQWALLKHHPNESKVPYDFNEPPAEFIKRVMNESYEKQVKRGWLTFNRQNDSYRPTVVGAYMMTWGLLWPISMVRKMKLSAEEAQVLGQFRGAGAGALRV